MKTFVVDCGDFVLKGITEFLVDNQDPDWFFITFGDKLQLRFPMSMLCRIYIDDKKINIFPE